MIGSDLGSFLDELFRLGDDLTGNHAAITDDDRQLGIAVVEHGPSGARRWLGLTVVHVAVDRHPQPWEMLLVAAPALNVGFGSAARGRARAETNEREAKRHAGHRDRRVADRPDGVRDLAVLIGWYVPFSRSEPWREGLSRIQRRPGAEDGF